MSLFESRLSMVASSRLAPLVYATAGGMLLLSASHARADDAGLEEIIVTAQKTGASAVQKTPIAVSAFSEADLKNSLTTNIKDLVAYTPGLNIGQTTASAQIYIRGVGTNNVYNGSDPDVTLQIDGVYMARPNEAFGDFLDVDRIEVLRGPQGTIYGRNAVGGTINIVSKTPSDVFTGTQELTVGNFATVEEQAYVSGPLIPGKLQGSLAVSYLRHDGYLKNISTGNDIYSANHGGLRGQLRFEASDSVTATTRFDFSKSGENGNSYSVLIAPVKNAPLADSLIGQWSKVALSNPQTEATYNGGVSEDVNWAIDPSLTLRSITAYRKDAYHVVVDSDATELPYQTSAQSEEEYEYTQEFNFQAHLDNFDGVTGIYYFHESDTSDINAIVTAMPGIVAGSPPRNVELSAFPVTKADAEAVFAQGTYHVLPTVALTAGYRYTSEDKSLHQDYQKYFVGPPVINLAPYPFVGQTTRYFHGNTPKFGIDWNVTSDAMMYFSATRGYKSGGMNYAASTVAAESFNPETIWSYEVGTKTDWFNHHLRVNLTGFKYDYNNLQVQSLIGPGLSSITNAATASVKGIEAEFQAKPTEAWKLTSNLTLLNARYNSFIAASVPAGLAPFAAGSPNYNPAAGTFNASGNRLDAAPHLTAFFAAQRDFDSDNGNFYYARAEYYWQDRVYYDPTNLDVQSQAPYGLVNLFVGYNRAGGSWQAQLYAKNVANKGYFITTAAVSLAPAGLTGAPRTFGARITKNF
jgi:iron complex outermembrane receptor protein